ncbi:hypothetical protein HZB94_04530 [Candidatus Falkowbacteria bacterium]|nr:hypothetical protein [Candidatus Falkowbacteria bacterium]
MKKNCDCLKKGHRVGLFLVALFVLCFLGYYVRPEQELHIKMLQMMFFGFSGMNVLSFILGAIQAFIWGYILSAIWCLTGCCCGCKDKCEK